MRYPAVAVANYFIDKANVEDEGMDHLRLQKLVYIAHGWHLAVYGTPLLSEKVEAWRYGPVISSLYHKFKHYGNKPIAENAVEFARGNVSVPNIEHGDAETKNLLERVWQTYSGLTGVQLANLTHEPGTPWDKAWRKAGEGRQTVQIPDKEIESHFRQLAARGS